MKAIIEIDLDIDGEWREEDRERLVGLIIENPGNRAWVIDTARLIIFAKSISCEVIG
jgi:hypothetical protein